MELAEREVAAVVCSWAARQAVVSLSKTGYARLSCATGY